MVKRKFKYAINHYLSIQPRPVHIGTVARILLRDHNIPHDTFDQDRFLREEDSDEIPADRLEVYAQLLDVPVDLLYQKD
ncbi:MAG: hypothetical protein KIT62_03695 [Cyclobacteriaceae bacterium]|nr:hypothetical protein [Cyclobacteriaceae bacterium]